MVQSNYSTFNSDNELSPTVFGHDGSGASSGSSRVKLSICSTHAQTDKIQYLVIAMFQAVVKAHSTTEWGGVGWGGVKRAEWIQVLVSSRTSWIAAVFTEPD